MPLETDRCYDDSRFWLLFDRVEDAEIAQSKLPWRDGIGTQHTFRFRVASAGSCASCLSTSSNTSV